MKATHLLAVVLSTTLLPVSATMGDEVFHNGGTGACSGCHTTPPALIGSDAGSTCLRCHQAPFGVTLPSKYYVATDPHSFSVCVQLPPGGDFCWLKKNYTWTASEGGVRANESSPGERHGHNVVAVDYGYEEDATLKYSPGGNYPSASLTCISCHDPHGYYRRLADGSISASGPPVGASGSYPDSPDPTATSAVGTYRMLAGRGYMPKTLSGVAAFTMDPPAAVSPRVANRAETTSDTEVAYGKGMSEWCQNCHGQISGSHVHPAGSTAVLTAEVAGNYNKYVNSGNVTGNPSSSYTSLVPFELNTKDYTILKKIAGSTSPTRSGPSGQENVMCLSCHRAHATGWDSMTRWNTQSDFVVYDGLYPGIDNQVPAGYAQGRLSLETQKTFYDRPATAYSRFQRSLCNKCHLKD